MGAAAEPAEVRAQILESDLAHQVLEFRKELRSLKETVDRLTDTRTVDRLDLGGVEKRLLAVEKKIDTALTNDARLMKHLGVPTE